MIIELFFQLVEHLLAIIKELGYAGIFLGMALESSFFPFHSEVILVPAGALVARGEMSFMLVFLAGIFGSLTGALINFFLVLFFIAGVHRNLFSYYFLQLLSIFT